MKAKISGPFSGSRVRERKLRGSRCRLSRIRYRLGRRVKTAKQLRANSC